MKTKFGKFMIIYVVLALFGMGFLWYKLWGIVDVYEQELPEYAMEDYINGFTQEHYVDLKMQFSDIKVSEFEDEEEIIEQFGCIETDWQNLEYKKKTGKYTNAIPVYSVIADGEEIAEVYFKENKEAKGRQKWSVDKEETQGIKLEGKENVSVSAPEDCKVFVNGVELGKDYVTGTTDEAQLLKNVKKYIDDIPQVNVYKVDGLYSKPEVKIQNAAGEDVECSINGNNYSYGFEATPEFAQENVPWIISMINEYALYLSNDGSFSKLTPYLYPDNTTEGLKSMLSTIGVIWYTDHTSTSLSDQKVSDIKQYSDNCFSCVVTFKQTVVGIGGSGDKTVVNDNKLICIFVKYNGEWKWAGMNTLEID